VRFYYSDGTCTIYHGDCREVLPGLPRADLLIADPPYGITARRGTADLNLYTKRFPNKWSRDTPPVTGDEAPFEPLHLLGAARNHILFGANYYADRLPASSAWLVWDKRRGGTVNQAWNGAHAELAWTDFAFGVRVFSHLWTGYQRDSEVGEGSLHPTQKPVALMAWIIANWTQPGDVILDPYMGSGPVLRAAKDLGRRAIGIEIEERYCEIAVRRLGQEVLAL